MIVYDVFVNGEFKETVTPDNQGIIEIHEYMTDKMKELCKKYNTQNIEADRRFA